MKGTEVRLKWITKVIGLEMGVELVLMICSKALERKGRLEVG